MPRCFLAIGPDEANREALAAAAREWDLPALKRTPPANLHITVWFFGDVPTGQLPGLTGALREACGEHGPFDVATARVELLPGVRRPRVLAALFDGGSALPSLHETIRTAAELQGFFGDARPYTPHMTLGRFKPPRHGPKPRIDPPRWSRPPVRWRVDRVELIGSELRPDGPVYTALAEFPLASGGSS